MAKTIQITAINPHVHLRDFEESHKEDLDTGTRAAVAGGFTTVIDMPNNKPPIVDGPSLQNKLSLAAQKVHCFYGAYLVATATNPREATEAAGLARGLKIYLDSTHGQLFLRELNLLIEHFKSWPANKPICIHAEDVSVPLAVGLAATYRKPIHLCHISQASEITYIKTAKEAGLPVTCEVTTHHLFLNEKDAERLGPLGYMKPVLKPEADVRALWDNLEVIDCVADDHAPHTLAEKRSDNPPPGVPSLETTLPLMLNAVTEGRLTLDRLYELVSTNPARIFHIPSQPETYANIDMAERYYLVTSQLQTKCGWSPFADHKLTGRIRQVFVKGQKVYKDGKFFDIDSRSLII